MANRAMAQKALKLQRQNAARPIELPATRCVTRDEIVMRDAETGERLSRNDVRLSTLNKVGGVAMQRKLALCYAPAGEWTLFPAAGGKPARW